MSKSSKLRPILVAGVIAAIPVAVLILANSFSATLSLARVTEARIGAEENEATGGTTCPGGVFVWDGEGKTNNWSEAANWCDSTVPPGGSIVVFNSTSIKNATVDIAVAPSQLFLNTGYSGTVTIASEATLTVANLNVVQGTLNLNAATIDVNNQLNISDTGIFNAGSGTVRLAGTLSVTDSIGAQFNADTSTFEFDGINGAVSVNNDTGNINFHSIVVNTTTDEGGLYFDTNGGVDSGNILGGLTLTNGKIGSGIVNAYGPVVYQPTFDGGGGQLYFYGTQSRTIDLPAGTPMVNFMGMSAANTTVNATGTGTLVFGSRWDVGGGAFNSNNADVSVQNSSLSGGALNIGSGTSFTSTALVNITAGQFNAIDAEFVRFGSVSISGTGILNGPASTMYVNGIFDISDVGGAEFNHNNGTAVFEGNNCGIAVNATIAGTARFRSLVVNLPSDLSVFSFDANGGIDSAIVESDIHLTNGTFVTGTLFAQGGVTVASTFDGGAGSLYFNGSSMQNFLNEGGLNPTGPLFIDKPSGSVTAVSDLILSPTQALNIGSGTLHLNDGSDLTVGNVTIGSSGRLVNSSSTTLTFGGNVSNSGRIDLQGGGADCPDGDVILIRSTVPGTQRQWNGTGTFRIVDANIQDMAGTAAITAYSSTNSGNVGANWTFNSGCPVPLIISPTNTTIYRGQTQVFTAGGGFAPRAFSLIQNNSGGFIDPTTGLYIAGDTINQTDIVRVTDAFGDIADATVNVIPGPPANVQFVVEPSNTSVGQPIAPPIQVAVKDTNGNTVPNATNAITLVLQNNPGGSTLSGTITRNAVNGIATFNDISLNMVGNGYTLAATSQGLTSSVSQAFDVPAGAPTQLVFDVQPTNVYPDQTFDPVVRVAILDSLGNRVTNATNPVSLVIGDNPNGGTLSYGGPVTPINGYASFAVHIRGTLNFGSGYSLIASSPGLPDVESQPFDVLSPFVVVNTNSGGLGSLRGAIGASNAAPGQQAITFNIPGNGPHTVNYIGAAAPIIVTDPVTIDGTTQPGYSGSPMIELNGSQYTAPNPAALTLQSPNNTIKGLAITGFSSTGIHLRAGSNSNVIVANYIGVSPNGNQASPNHRGITVESNQNIIGGSDPSQRNVISGNSTGVSLLGQNRDNTIKGNFVGTAPDGTTAMSNLMGIYVDYGLNVIIGGSESGDANVIAFNTSDGIRLGSRATGVSILRNSIHSNGGLGIDLAPVGSNGNDSCDADTGSNLKQNSPRLLSADLRLGMIEVQAILVSVPNETYTIDYYANPSFDSSGFGEGKTWIGSRTVTTLFDCRTEIFSFYPSTIPPGTTNITATATDSAGRTSEFSSAVGTPTSIAGTVRDSSNFPVSGVSVQLRSPVSGPIQRTARTDSAGRFVFSGLDRGGAYSVTLTKENYIFTPPSRDYPVLNSSADDNYTATINYLSINGRVSTNGLGVPGVTVALSGAANRTTTTDSSGNYRFTNLSAGVYTVTPSRTNFSFSPNSSTQEVTVNTAIGFSATNNQAGLTGSILFESFAELRRINANGTGLVTLRVQQGSYPIGSTAISNDGTKIVFNDAYDGLKTMNFDGSGESTIFPYQGSGRDLLAWPRWSPDRSKIAFSAFPDWGSSQSNFRIYVVNSTGGSATQVTSGAEDKYPVWSADSSNILFNRSTISSGSSLFKVSSSGANLTQLINGPVSYPAWAPNDSQIAFIGADGISVANTNGTNQQLLIPSTTANTAAHELDYSPNSQRLLFRSANSHQVVSASALDGGSLVVHADGIGGTWGSVVAVPVSSGTGVTAASGRVRIQFGGIPVSPAGVGANEVTFEPIAPESIGEAPASYRFTQTGYQLGISGTFSPPATVCIEIPVEQYAASSQFQSLRLLSFNAGVFTDMTSLPNNETDRTVCGDATSLGGFVVAELFDPTMPSIIGQLVNSDGDPIADHLVILSGDEERLTRTDDEGLFEFTNLSSGGDYAVAPNQHGYLFDNSSIGFDTITGEKTAVFRGIAAAFSVSGRVTNADGTPVEGAEVTMTGSSEESTTTDVNGQYSFSGLAANSAVEIAARSGASVGAPISISITDLSADMVEQDFILLAPKAAQVSIGGRVFTSSGNAIGNAVVSIADLDGNVRSARTGSFGYFYFDGLDGGRTYVVTVTAKGRSFTDRVVMPFDDVTDLDFISLGPEQ